MRHDILPAGRTRRLILLQMLHVDHIFSFAAAQRQLVTVIALIFSPPPPAGPRTSRFTSISASVHNSVDGPTQWLLVSALKVAGATDGILMEQGPAVDGLFFFLSSLLASKGLHPIACGGADTVHHRGNVWPLIIAVVQRTRLCFLCLHRAALSARPS